MKEMPPLYLVCAGGHGRVVAAAAEAAGRVIAGFLDDDQAGNTVLGYPVLDRIEALSRLGPVHAVVCLGDNRGRLALAARFPHVQWDVFVHPRALVHHSVVLGAGTVVMANAVVQPGSRLGEQVIVNTAAIVEHDARIGRGAHLASGVALGGRVRIDEGSLLGTGSCVRSDIHIGAWATVGVGSVVIRNVGDGMTVAGCPAAPLHSRSG